MPVASSCAPDGAEVAVPPVVLASDCLFDRCRAHEDRSAFAGSVSGACVEVCYVDRVSFPYFPSFSLIIVVLVGICTTSTGSLTTVRYW